MAKIITFSGSIRRDSFNKKLANHAADIAQELGLDVTRIDLADYDIPLYHGDLEEASGKPETAKALKQIFVEHDGFILSSPEYNSSFSPLLKNTLDWISRPDPDDAVSLPAFHHKAALLLAASPGALGGLRGLVHVRSMLSNIGMYVHPEQMALPKAHEAFDGNGRLKDDSRLRKTVEAYADYVNQLFVN